MKSMQFVFTVGNEERGFSSGLQREPAKLEKMYFVGLLSMSI
jgi:hypothetical protein